MTYCTYLWKQKLFLIKIKFYYANIFSQNLWVIFKFYIDMFTFINTRCSIRSVVVLEYVERNRDSILYIIIQNILNPSIKII